MDGRFGVRSTFRSGSESPGPCRPDAQPSREADRTCTRLWTNNSFQSAAFGRGVVCRPGAQPAVVTPLGAEAGGPFTPGPATAGSALGGRERGQTFPAHCPHVSQMPTKIGLLLERSRTPAAPRLPSWENFSLRKFNQRAKKMQKRRERVKRPAPQSFVIRRVKDLEFLLQA